MTGFIFWRNAVCLAGITLLSACSPIQVKEDSSEERLIFPKDAQIPQATSPKEIVHQPMDKPLSDHIEENLLTDKDIDQESDQHDGNNDGYEENSQEQGVEIVSVKNADKLETTNDVNDVDVLNDDEESESNQQAIIDLCNALGKRLGSVTVKGCLSHQLKHDGSTSYNGHALAYKDYQSQLTSAPRVLVIGGIHGDEYSSFSLLFRLLERLDADHQHLKQHWRLIPAANPDGLLDSQPAQRYNARGVDLNRNFATSDWDEKALKYWKQRTKQDKRRYPGDYAESEPETRWLSEQLREWSPDVIVSVHAPYGILDFDNPQPIRIRAPQRIGFLHLNLLGTYPGSLGRYGANDWDIPVLTLELPHAGIMPSKKQQAALWKDLEHWIDIKFSAEND